MKKVWDHWQFQALHGLRKSGSEMGFESISLEHLTDIRDYILSKKDYLMKPVGNPEGEDKPNKKYYEKKRVEEGLEDFSTANQL